MTNHNLDASKYMVYWDYASNKPVFNKRYKYKYGGLIERMIERINMEENMGITQADLRIRWEDTKRKVLNKYKNKIQYEFIVPNFQMINFDEISKEISKKNPIAYITIQNEQKLVIIHSSIIKKAEIIDFPLPDPENITVFKHRQEYSILILEKIFDKYKPSFRKITKWVKDVIDADWNTAKEEKTVKVTVPNI